MHASGNLNRLLVLTAILEAGTGVALLISPVIVAKLLLGDDVSGSGVVVGRLAGCALLAFGIACWPERAPRSSNAPLRGMLCYNLLVALLLLAVGIGGQTTGILLWPAVALHFVVGILLARYWFSGAEAGSRGPGI